MAKNMNGKGRGLYIISIVCALIAVAAYIIRGGDIFAQVLPVAVGVTIVGAVLGIIMMIKPITPLELVPFVCFFAFFLIFAGTEIEFIANVAYGTDGQAIDPAFVVTALFSFVAAITGMVGVIKGIKKD